jgi:hypothetical protein
MRQGIFKEIDWQLMGARLANEGDIEQVAFLKSFIKECLSWETHQDDKGNVGVTCHITHAQGHRESVSLKGPIDESGNKNRIQAVGSTVSYLERYTLLAALGLATGEDDDDVGGLRGENREPIQQPRAKKTNGETLTVRGIIEEVDVKTGENRGKPWTRYGVKINGQYYGSFSDTVGELAQSCQNSEAVVSYTSDGKHSTIVELVPVLTGEAA